MEDFHEPNFVIDDFKTQFFPAFDQIQSFSKTIPTFFRGHGQADWELVPEIGRVENSFIVENNFEKNMFTDFAAHAHMVIGEMTNWDILFSMRHHKLPTRLLDWTDSLFVALFFSMRAFENASKQKAKKDLKNPCLWVLRSGDLNKKTTGVKGLTCPRSLYHFLSHTISPIC